VDLDPRLDETHLWPTQFSFDQFAIGYSKNRLIATVLYRGCAEAGAACYQRNTLAPLNRRTSILRAYQLNSRQRRELS
jgi:hypothetical protein